MSFPNTESTIRDICTFLDLLYLCLLHATVKIYQTDNFLDKAFRLFTKNFKMKKRLTQIEPFVVF